MISIMILWERVREKDRNIVADVALSFQWTSCRNLKKCSISFSTDFLLWPSHYPMVHSYFHHSTITKHVSM